MAFIKCSGGALREIELWRNPNPYASFSQQDVSLLEDINNFDYIEFKYMSDTTTGSIVDEFQIISPVEIFKQTYYGGGIAHKPGVNLAASRSNNTSEYRRWVAITRDSTTSCHFNNSATYTQSSSAYNIYCIPTSIYGLK